MFSGPGLHAIYEYVRDSAKRMNRLGWRRQIEAGDPAAEIAEAGLKGQADIAKQTLDLFASIYGAEAGNLALKAMALNGVYIGGGIAPKLLAKLKDGTFMKAFTNKGRYKRLLSTIPVHVVLNDRAGLTRGRLQRRTSSPNHELSGSRQAETRRGSQGRGLCQGRDDRRPRHRLHGEAPGRCVG